MNWETEWHWISQEKYQTLEDIQSSEGKMIFNFQSRIKDLT